MDEIIVDLIPEGDGGKFHLLNSPGEEFRNILARTTNQASPLNMKIKMVEIHHGEMKSDEGDCFATLLVLEFRFQSRLQEHRYKTASVTLEFVDKGGRVKRDPAVVQMAPDRMNWMNQTRFDRTTKFGVSLGATGGVDVVNGNINMHWEVEQKKPLKFKATLTGFSSRNTNSYSEQENMVTWAMQENPDEDDGIPSFLQTAVLLKRSHNVPFCINLRVKSDVDLASTARRFFHFKGDEDRMIQSITITPKEAQISNSDITGVKESDLKQMHLLPVSRYFRVNNSEDVLAMPPTPVTGMNETTPPPLSTAPQVSVTTDQLSSPKITSSSAQPMPDWPTSAVAARVAASAARAAAKAARAAAEAAEAAAQAAEIAAEQL